ncbi:hypothetical protein H6P81_009285 [Aristolochia fimbriata]|uniref:Uncharacterized protein n=1 Tax=Aristolochia fimbriata TaxID=158543 RepID=A0AAV7EMJ0_ARIFI|nr:hypothetical protein H6P81_009285 [Aristolochia fimbriata]
MQTNGEIPAGLSPRRVILAVRLLSRDRKSDVPAAKRCTRTEKGYEKDNDEWVPATDSRGHVTVRVAYRDKNTKYYTKSFSFFFRGIGAEVAVSGPYKFFPPVHELPPSSSRRRSPKGGGGKRRERESEKPLCLCVF